MCAKVAYHMLFDWKEHLKKNYGFGKLRFSYDRVDSWRSCCNFTYGNLFVFEVSIAFVIVWYYIVLYCIVDVNGKHC